MSFTLLPPAQLPALPVARPWTGRSCACDGILRCTRERRARFTLARFIYPAHLYRLRGGGGVPTHCVSISGSDSIWTVLALFAAVFACAVARGAVLGLGHGMGVGGENRRRWVRIDSFFFLLFFAAWRTRHSSDLLLSDDEWRVKCSSHRSHSLDNTCAGHQTVGMASAGHRNVK